IWQIGKSIPCQTPDHLAPQIAPNRKNPSVSAALRPHQSSKYGTWVKADNSANMIRHMKARSDPYIEIHWNRENPLDWNIEIHETDEIPSCCLSFRLPENLLKALQDKGARSQLRSALDMKEQHFSRITIFRVTERKTLACTLRLDYGWLSSARNAIDQPSRRQREHRPRADR
ncbi:MAG: hypothetical protein ACRC67_14830, partial [Inquilinus sp.]|uniref:hypothetical protein n=1 Tax=Inquilinus sp. TaxID=1932117 RepID=UPI003F2A034A